MFAQIAHFYHVPSNCAILSCSIKLRNFFHVRSNCAILSCSLKLRNFFHVRSNCAINPTLKVHDPVQLALSVHTGVLSSLDYPW